MGPIAIIGLGALALWFLSKGKGGGTVNTYVIVFDEDGRPVEGLRRGAAWHSTPEQTAKFGPRVPNFYTYDEGGLFAFMKPYAKGPGDGGLVDHDTGKLYPNVRDFADFYKPTWKVEVS